MSKETGNETWVCSIDSSHVYDKETAKKQGYFCPLHEEYGVAVLIRTNHPPVIKKPPTQEEVPDWIAPPPPPPPPPPPQEDLGLCIMLLDCSKSMTDPAFENHPSTKRDLIVKSVSQGIFSLSGNPLRRYAYILIIGFDHTVTTLVPYTSIEKVVEEYGNVDELARALKEKMDLMNGATDINGVLEKAFKFCQDFIDSKIEALGAYKPRYQSVLDENMISHQVPNVRVLLFTDGGQFMGEGKTTINPSPFKNLKSDGKTIDLLMSAYYGTKQDKDYEKLRALVSKCPKHPKIDQFFLFDDPSKLANLKGLFRMASGASGFCPVCLEEGNTVMRGL